MRLLVIGGSDAGIAAALRARELDPSVEATVVVVDAFPNFSICGLPYYLSGDVPDWRNLAHRTTSDLEQAGIQLLLDHTAQAIDPAAKQVTVTSQHGERQLRYDQLVIGTGAVPMRPPIDGLDLPGVHVLHTMADTFALHQALTAGTRSAVIVGGGYIGLEMAEAFTARGLNVTLVEQAPAVMPTVDLELGRLLGEELARHDVQVVNDVTVKAIHSNAGGLTVAGEPDFTATADLVLVVVGVRPDTDLAVAAGVQTGIRGALRVDRHMRTNLPDVLAAGDCVETWHRLLDRPAYLPLGTTAHKQGRVAGETAVGGDRTFAGSLGTQVVKVFELAVARTGLRDQEAQAAGFDPLTVGSTQDDHKAYYPGAHQLHLRITGDQASGQLLGVQLVGDHRAEVAKRIDIPANALFHHMTVDGLSDLDLSYTPPFGSPGTPSNSPPKPGPRPGEPRPLPAPPRESGHEAAAIPRQEDAYFPLFEAAADTIAAAAALLELLTDLADPETKAMQLAELEHEGDRITRTILTRLASTFVGRLDRDDIFELAERLDNVTDAIDDVGDMVFLHGITEPLDPVTEQPTGSSALQAGAASAFGVPLPDFAAPDLDLGIARVSFSAPRVGLLTEQLASASWRLLGARTARARAIARAREQATEEAEMLLGRLRGATSQQLGEAARQLGARLQRHQAALAASLSAAIDRGAGLLAEAEDRRDQRTAELRRATELLDCDAGCGAWSGCWQAGAGRESDPSPRWPPWGVPCG